MAAVTQRISNFLGGVSRQPDSKKLPGQVRECLNAYPDPTFENIIFSATVAMRTIATICKIY